MTSKKDKIAYMFDSITAGEALIEKAKEKYADVFKVNVIAHFATYIIVDGVPEYKVTWRMDWMWTRNWFESNIDGEISDVEIQSVGNLDAEHKEALTDRYPKTGILK